MARKQTRPTPSREEVLDCVQRQCPECGGALWIDYENRRTVSTLTEVVRLRLKVRRCQHAGCSRYRVAYRPEAEGYWALAEHEFGLDVVARIGSLRYQQHQTVCEIWQCLQGLGVVISRRSISNLLDRYDELMALHLGQSQRLQAMLQAQGRVILAIDGMQPEVGHEVLWIIRDCLSGEVLLARSLLSSESEALVGLLREVGEQLPVPVAAVISDGQLSIRKAVAAALPETAHALCHFHYLREAVRPLYEADRHAKKELKKRVRGVRGIERQVEGQATAVSEAVGEVVLGYCAAVRSALTDDGRPPLHPSGLRLEQRLSAIEASLARAAQKGGCPADSFV